GRGRLQLLVRQRPGERAQRGIALIDAEGPASAGPSVRNYARGVRVLLWHGYLLGGTGSNVYTQALAREWSRAGHEVTVVCQERHPEQYELGGASVVRPELPGRLLPVFVLDRYEGLEPVLLQDMSVRERA